MSKKSYNELLKDPRWQKRRLEILERDGFKCTWCWDKDSTLHVNHAYYAGKPWEAHDFDLYTLCEKCHIIHHENKKLSRRDSQLLEIAHPVFSEPDWRNFKKADIISLIQKMKKNGRDRTFLAFGFKPWENG